jgi:hypothetical protein
MKAFLRILPRPDRGKALVPTQSSAPLVLFLHTFPTLVWGRGYAPSSRIEGTLIFLWRCSGTTERKKAGILRSRRAVGGCPDKSVIRWVRTPAPQASLSMFPRYADFLIAAGNSITLPRCSGGSHFTFL